MFNNCRQYNKEGSTIVEEANTLEKLLYSKATDLELGIDVKPDDDGERISCTMCPGSYKNQDSLDAHCRKAHNIFKRATVSPVVTIAIKAQNNKTPAKPNQNIIKIENDSANDSMNVDGSKCPICK